ncbi:MAG: M12 family metallopeptidase [Rhodobacter sp.]|nr:M12 family metallopeptidase [Rhodobacter sp.]
MMKRVLLAVGLALTWTVSAVAQGFQLSDAADELRFVETSGQLETVDLRIEGELRSISFVTDDAGNAIYQGDIILGRAETLWELSESSDLSLQGLAQTSTELFGLVARDERLRWPDGRVPYIIDASVPSSWIPRVRQAIRAWEQKTDIQFKELRRPKGAYLLFFDHPEQNSCQTRIGYPSSGPRKIQLATWCQWGNIAHEIGHALGLHHEQTRFDRDRFVQVAFSAAATNKMKAQFRADPNEFKDSGPYCYDSIMHYAKTDKNRSFLITALAEPGGDFAGDPKHMGQRSAISPCDVETIERIYGFIADAEPDIPLSGFEGELAFYPEGCEETRKCFLANDLRYTDPYSLVWLASKRDTSAGAEIQSGTTDGASIPEWAQPFVGRPFDPSYIKAAVIHDHYTYPENRVRSWWSSQRVFHDMLQDLGVPRAKTQIMYLGVLLGSQKWIRLVPGDDCGVNCINDISEAATTVQRTEEAVYREWPETYDSKEYEEAMKAGIAVIALHGEQMTLGDLNALAAYLMPDHPVFTTSDEYTPTGLSDIILGD